VRRGWLLPGHNAGTTSCLTLTYLKYAKVMRMALHVVGETLDKARSHYLAGKGKLVQLMRGIYVDAADDIDQTVLAHAVRVGRYLYPNAYLSAASAILLGLTRDGRLYLTGRRVQRTRIGALEIVQNNAPTRPALASATVADSLGEFSVNVSSIRQRSLEAFRLCGDARGHRRPPHRGIWKPQGHK
jgi:serine/threonine-protein kinase HipA